MAQPKKKHTSRPQPAQDRRRRPTGHGAPVDCPVARSCGGCALIGTPYAEQLRFKRETIRRTLGKERTLRQVPVARCIPSPLRTGYRSRAKLATVVQGKRVQIGLYQRHTNRIIDAAPCIIHRPAIQTALEPIRAWLGAHGLSQPQGPIKHLDLRESADGRLVLTLVSIAHPRRLGMLPVDELQDRLEGRLDALGINHSPQKTSYVFGDHTTFARGPEFFQAPLPPGRTESPSLNVPNLGFFQINASQIPGITREMWTFLSEVEPRVVADLFCGVGTWGLLLAAGPEGRGIGRVLGIEEVESAIDCAKMNAQQLGLADRSAFRAGRVEQVFPRLARKEPVDAVIINPGRPGCRGEVLGTLLRSGARRAVYLSCNPYTLARDLTVLRRGGMRATQVIPVDMMPQTDQVEAMALLEAKKPKEPKEPSA